MYCTTDWTIVYSISLLLSETKTFSLLLFQIVLQWLTLNLPVLDMHRYIGRIDSRNKISRLKVNTFVILLDIAKLPANGVMPFCILTAKL